MEEGSLLADILSRKESSKLYNSLLVDVFLLKDPIAESSSSSSSSTMTTTATTTDHLLALASLATRLNAYIQQQRYPWIQGADGPVFGIHVQDKCPCLRAQCRYDVSVADEWALIHFVLQFLRHEKTNDDDDDDDKIAVECWDEDDGQIILIEAAHQLPAWVDEIGPAACRHVCWIRNQGRIVLIPPPTMTTTTNKIGTPCPPLTRRQALNILLCDAGGSSSCSSCLSIPSIDEAIRQRTASSVWKHPLVHKTAVALPCSVAHMLGQHPELLHPLVSAWVDLIQQKEPFSSRSSSTTTTNTETKARKPTPSSTTTDLLWNEGWQWTVQSWSRLAYAQCRTLTSQTDTDWSTPESIPRRYRQKSSPSFRRLQAQAKNHATPHLQNAVALGVRLVAGLEYILETAKSRQERTKSPMHFGSPLEERVLNYWAQIDAALGTTATTTSNDCRPGEWLRQAWMAGPNHAQYSLENVLRCPVYNPEVCNRPYPITFPGQSLDQIIERLLKSAPQEPWGDSPTVPPSREQVDLDESWLDVSEDTHFLKQYRHQSSNAHDLDHEDTENGNDTQKMQQFLDGVQTFMAGKSHIEGVEHGSTSSIKSNSKDHEDTTSTLQPPHHQPESQVNIRPAAFLHLLRETLASPSVADLEKYLSKPPETRDMYFSEEDYNLMDPNGEDGDEDGSVDEDMVAMMEQMDKELGVSACRNIDVMEDQVVPNPDVAEEAHVLANLLESVDASAGASGPVRNILQEMGKQVP